MMTVQEIQELEAKVQQAQYGASLALGGVTYFFSRKAFKTWPWPVKIIMFLLISNAYLTVSEQVKQWYIKKKIEEGVAQGVASLQQNVQEFAGKAQTLLSGLTLPFSGGGGGSAAAEDTVDDTQSLPLPDDTQMQQQPF